MRRFLTASARAALALWTGAIAGIAFAVAPRVFRYLDDPRRAGELLRPIFRRVDLFGIGVSLLGIAAVFAADLRRWRALLLAAMGGAAATNAFLLAPLIEARDDRFALWHRLSEGCWGMILVAGTLLLLTGEAPRSGRSP